MCDLSQKCIAGGAGGSFQTIRIGMQQGRVKLGHVKWKAAASRQRCHKFALNFRRGTQSVVHMGHMQGQSPGRRQLPQNMQQADTVGPAADRYHHREGAVSLQVKQSMLCLGMDNGRPAADRV